MRILKFKKKLVILNWERKWERALKQLVEVWISGEIWISQCVSSDVTFCINSIDINIDSSSDLRSSATCLHVRKHKPSATNTRKNVAEWVNWKGKIINYQAIQTIYDWMMLSRCKIYFCLFIRVRIFPSYNKTIFMITISFYPF